MWVARALRHYGIDGRPVALDPDQQHAALTRDIWTSTARGSWPMSARLRWNEGAGWHWYSARAWKDLV
ncbi:MAG TPA: hypothetical protein VF082_00530 [Jiangellaceae bacterium]